MQPFDSKIRGVIDKIAYPVWFIIRDEDTDCSCVDFTTKQADPKCKKCLGTGKQITIKRVNAAHTNNRIALRGEGLGMSEINVIGVYYTKIDCNAKENDLVVDGNCVDIIQHSYPERSDHNDPVYYRHETAPKHTNLAPFMKNFKETLKGAGYNE